MAGDKTVPRGERHYASDPPRRRRLPCEEFVLCDGVYLNPEVESYTVLPKASTRRQVMKRSMVLKSGSFANGVIVFSLSEAEKQLLNSMGSAAPSVVE